MPRNKTQYTSVFLLWMPRRLVRCNAIGLCLWLLCRFSSLSQHIRGIVVCFSSCVKITRMPSTDSALDRGLSVFGAFISLWGL